MVSAVSFEAGSYYAPLAWGLDMYLHDRSVALETRINRSEKKTSNVFGRMLRQKDVDTTQKSSTGTFHFMYVHLFCCYMFLRKGLILYPGCLEPIRLARWS